MLHRTLTCLVVLLLATPSRAAGATAVPFDEETLDQIDSLNRAISDHYEELQSSSTEIEARRAVVESRISGIEEELDTIERERRELPPEQREADSPAARLMEEHRIEVKSRYLEVLAERHARRSRGDPLLRRSRQRDPREPGEAGRGVGTFGSSRAGRQR